MTTLDELFTRYGYPADEMNEKIYFYFRRADKIETFDKVQHLCLIGTSKIELHKGCGIFINSGVLHRFEAQSNTFAPNIVFSPTLFAPENSLIYEKYILPVISSSVPYQVFSPSRCV